MSELAEKFYKTGKFPWMEALAAGVQIGDLFSKIFQGLGVMSFKKKQITVNTDLQEQIIDLVGEVTQLKDTVLKLNQKLTDGIEKRETKV